VKYSKTTIIMFLSLFLFAELFGLFVNKQYFKKELPYGLEPTKTEFSVGYLLSGIIVFTIIYFLLLKLKINYVVKLWYVLAVFLCSLITLNSFMDSFLALISAFILVILKLSNKFGIVFHDISEVIVYAGVVPLFSPLFNMAGIIILMVFLSIYDIISVFGTKHMIKLVKSQQKLKIFAGLIVRYKDENALLGGGDVIFPVLFASVVSTHIGFLQAILSIYGAAVGLLFLVLVGKKGKFYPAIPFIAAGEFIFFILSLLL